MGVFRRFKDSDRNQLGNSLAILPVSPRESMTISVSKNASVMENEALQSVNIQKIRGSFYNYAGHGQSTMSGSKQGDDAPRTRYSYTGPLLDYSKPGGAKMKFIKNAVLPMLPAMTTEEDLVANSQQEYFVKPIKREPMNTTTLQGDESGTLDHSAEIVGMNENPMFLATSK